MTSVALACHAMATRFEIVLHGDNPVALRAAGEEALEEIQQLENQLSAFRPGSELARLNDRAGQGPVRVEPGLFALLQQARQLHRESGGTFDITVGPLMRCWGFREGSGTVPSPERLSHARARIGMHLVELSAKDFTVRFQRDGVQLDLGAIGKGYALDRAAELLREAGITSALLHGGTSTVYALGCPPDAEAWKVAISCPHSDRGGGGLAAGTGLAAEGGMPPAAGVAVAETAGHPATGPSRLTVVSLRDEALSVSEVSGRFFLSQDRTCGHIMDPRTGAPAAAALLAAVVLPSATESDALSTALLTVGLAGHDAIASLRPGMRTLVLEWAENEGSFRGRSRDLEWHCPPRP